MPTKLKLRYYGDPVLRKPAKRVTSIGSAERLFIKELIQAMYAFDGAGLAAPQVGVDEQIFVADAGEGPFAVINPEFLKYSTQETVMEEGCLSFPEIRISVQRPEAVYVRYQNELGQTIERDFSGLWARIFQHESDHLFARMIIDYASKTELAKYKDKLAALEARAQKPASRSRAHV